MQNSIISLENSEIAPSIRANDFGKKEDFEGGVFMQLGASLFYAPFLRYLHQYEDHEGDDDEGYQ